MKQAPKAEEVFEKTGLVSQIKVLTFTELLKLAEVLPAESLWKIAQPKGQDIIAANQAVTDKHLVEDGFLTGLHCRLYPSFQDIALKVIPELKSKGAKDVYLLGAFQKSPISHKINKFLPDDKFHPLFYSRSEKDGNKVTSILRYEEARENANHDFWASTFSIVDYEPDPEMGGWEGFEFLLARANECGIRIVLDIVAQGTAIEFPWLQNEELQKGPVHWNEEKKIWEGYYYIHKTLPEDAQKELLALDDARNLPDAQKEELWTDEQRLFVQLANNILAQNPGHVLHYSPKLKQWVLIANGQDFDMKKNNKQPWHDILQLDLSNPFVREAIFEKAEKLINAGAAGFRADCAMASVMHGEYGFLDTWYDYIGERVVEKEFWTELIERLRKIRQDAVFYAEAYWLFDVLDKCGFNYIFQKFTGDSLVSNNIPGLRGYLIKTPMQEQFSRLHAVNNHDDEPSYIRDIDTEHFKEAPELTARLLFRDLLNIAALPGKPQIQAEQLLGGYFARGTARWHSLDTVDEPHEIVKMMAAKAAQISRDELFRKGNLYVLNNWSGVIFGFLRYHNNRQALIVSNSNNEYSNYYEQISIKEAAPLMGISQQPGVFYALVNRLNGEVCLVSGEQLYNKLLNAYLPEQAQVQIYMFEELKDDSGVLRKLSKRNELRWDPPYIDLKTLTLEDVCLLVNDFGLKIDYPCDGKISKALALKYLLDKLTPKEIYQNLIQNNNIEIVEFASEEEMIKEQINQLRQKFSGNEKIISLCLALEMLNQKGQLNKKKFLWAESAGKTEIKVKDNMICIAQGDSGILYPDTREGKQKIRACVDTVEGMISRKNFRSYGIEEEITKFIEAYLMLSDREIYNLMIELAGVLPEACDMIEEHAENISGNEWRRKVVDIFESANPNRFIARVWMNYFCRRVPLIEWFNHESFGKFFAHYLSSRGEIDTICSFIEAGLKREKIDTYYHCLFFEPFVIQALAIHNEQVDRLFVEFLESPQEGLEEADRLKRFIIWAMKKAERFDLKIKDVPLKEILSILEAADKPLSVLEAVDFTLNVQLFELSI
ncbi:MAG: hypothetical protein HY810_04250 [Candidatus Omnitrophica bacterium]|nr:hypothetical protein [Candidatus Omnitrophota bacterium]